MRVVDCKERIASEFLLKMEKSRDNPWSDKACIRVSRLQAYNVDEDDVDVDVRCPVLVPFLPRPPLKGTLWGAVKA